MIDGSCMSGLSSLGKAFINTSRVLFHHLQIVAVLKVHTFFFIAGSVFKGTLRGRQILPSLIIVSYFCSRKRSVAVRWTVTSRCRAREGQWRTERNEITTLIWLRNRLRLHSSQGVLHQYVGEKKRCGIML